MPLNLLFAIGTLLTWLGWAAALRGLYLLGQLLIGVPNIQRKTLQQALILSGVLAAVLLAAAAALPMKLEKPTEATVHIPLFWVVMPFFGWAFVTAVVMTVLRWIQAWLALNQKERLDRCLAGIIWLLVGLACLWLFKRDDSNRVEVFKGAIPLDLNFAAALMLLAIAGLLAMIMAARWAAARGVTKALITHAALLAGSIVFGLPFAFLVVTSFKEDRDMSSQEGIIWIPRVQETVPYKDPKNPLFETTHDGQRIVATILEKRSDGTARVEVQEPRAILGTTFETEQSALKEIPRQAKLVKAKLSVDAGELYTDVNGDGVWTNSEPFVDRNSNGVFDSGEAFTDLNGDGLWTAAEPYQDINRNGTFDGKQKAVEIRGMVVEDLEDGSQRVRTIEPKNLKGREFVFKPGQTEPVRHVGLRWQNYTEALSFLPPETNNGLVYVRNTLLIVIFSVVGTILSSSVVAYAFSRMKFPGRDALFAVLLSTMMLPAAVTMLPQFLIFRWFGWIDTLYPLWVPAFFASAFNVFLLRQFFKQIPMELEDAAKIDGANYLKTFWTVMLPQIKPALAVIAIWTFMGAWNNFMGPLIYINSPENMPLSYALQLFNGDRSGEPGLLMAFATMTILPVLMLFFFAQKYFIEGVTLSGFGGR